VSTVVAHLWDIAVQIIVYVLVVVGAVAFVFSLRASAEEYTNYAVVFAICTATVVAIVVHV
jgi:uncharacterized membrane protein